MRGKPPLSPQLLLHLQVTAGNQAVRRLLESRAATHAEVTEPLELVVAPLSVSAVPVRLSLWQRLRRKVRWRRVAAPEGEAPRLLQDQS